MINEYTHSFCTLNLFNNLRTRFSTSEIKQGMIFDLSVSGFFSFIGVFSSLTSNLKLALTNDGMVESNFLMRLPRHTLSAQADSTIMTGEEVQAF